jgi:heme oxygenase
MPDAKSHKTHYSQAKHNEQLEATSRLKIIKVANKYFVVWEKITMYTQTRSRWV